MKRIIIFILIFVIIFGFSLSITPSKTLINNYGVSIKDNEYHNLLNLGFTNYEIMNMSLKELNSNKNLNGKIIFKNINESNKVKNQLLSINNIVTYGTKTGYIETPSKILTTTIIAINGRYRYKVSLTWKNMPSIRSYDILGIGIDNNVKIVSDLYFKYDFCYSKNECNSSSSHTKKITSTGGLVSFELSHRKVISMNAYLYFEVDKNTDSIITELNAYGDYAHRVKSIRKNDIKNYSINRSGISLPNSISNYYDSISTAKATWTGSW